MRRTLLSVWTRFRLSPLRLGEEEAEPRGLPRAFSRRLLGTHARTYPQKRRPHGARRPPDCSRAVRAVPSEISSRALRFYFGEALAPQPGQHALPTVRWPLRSAQVTLAAREGVGPARTVPQIRQIALRRLRLLSTFAVAGPQTNARLNS